MTDAHPLRQMLQSTGAVLAGVLAGIVLSLGTDELLRVAGIFPPLGVRVADHLLAFATVYRTVFGVASAYVTAMLAPRRPMLHVMVLGFLGLWANIVGTVATWNKGPQFGPHWYPIALIVLAVPTAWAGGRVYLARHAAKGNQ